jgi:hypothetical protein
MGSTLTAGRRVRGFASLAPTGRPFFLAVLAPPAAAGGTAGVLAEEALACAGCSEPDAGGSTGTTGSTPPASAGVAASSVMRLL